MSSRVVHVRDNVPGAVYIGRAMPRQGLKASPFANPFKIGRIGGTFDSSRNLPATRSDVIRWYRYYLVDGLSAGNSGKGGHLLAQLPDLRGKPLACWCRHDGEERSPDNACHGDVLANLLNTYTDDELRAMAQVMR